MVPEWLQHTRVRVVTRAPSRGQFSWLVPLKEITPATPFGCGQRMAPAWLCAQLVQHNASPASSGKSIIQSDRREITPARPGLGGQRMAPAPLWVVVSARLFRGRFPGLTPRETNTPARPRITPARWLPSGHFLCLVLVLFEACAMMEDMAFAA